MYVNKILFRATSCSPLPDFSGAAVIWKPCWLWRQELASHLRDLLAYLPKFELSYAPKSGTQYLAFPTCRVCIASAEFSTMNQEPPVITGARYPGPSDITADNKARLLRLRELSRSKKQELRSHQAPQSTPRRAILPKGAGLVLEKFKPAITAHCPCHPCSSCECEIKFPNQVTLFETQFLPLSNCFHSSHLSH